MLDPSHGVPLRSTATQLKFCQWALPGCHMDLNRTPRQVKWTPHAMWLDDVEFSFGNVPIETVIPLDILEQVILARSSPHTTIAYFTVELRTDNLPRITSFPTAVVVKSGFSSPAPDHLRFDAGETVTVLRLLSDNWYDGMARGKQGRFPCWKLVELTQVTRAAEEGDCGAQRELGCRYEWGFGVEKDMYTACKWFSAAAEEGDPAVQCKLGWCFEHGHGVEIDVNACFKWYERAANAGYRDGEFSLGVCYNQGTGTASDLNKAMDLFCSAAKKGHMYAQYNYGLYLWEDYVPARKNQADAAVWFHKSAEQGCVEAMYAIACRSHSANDMDEALTWYTRAAERGHPASCAGLKELIADGKGRTKIP